MCMVKLMTWSNLFYCVRTMRLYVIRYSFYFMYIFSLLDWMMFGYCLCALNLFLNGTGCLCVLHRFHSLTFARNVSVSWCGSMDSHRSFWVRTTHNGLFCIAMEASPIPRTIYSYVWFVFVAVTFFSVQCMHIFMVDGVCRAPHHLKLIFNDAMTDWHDHSFSIQFQASFAWC